MKQGWFILCICFRIQALQFNFICFPTYIWIDSEGLVKEKVIVLYDYLILQMLIIVVALYVSFCFEVKKVAKKVVTLQPFSKLFWDAFPLNIVSLLLKQTNSKWKKYMI